MSDGIDALDECDLAIFVSANAVKKSVDAINKRWPQLPERLSIAAIGPTTRRTLVENGIGVDIIPSEKFTSEALLSTPELEYVDDWNIQIYKGEGGLDALHKRLTNRGARVRDVFTYRREIPKVNIEDHISDWKDGGVQVVICSSGESLQNLETIVGDKYKSWLQTMPFVVISERVATIAKERDVSQEPIVAQTATDTGLTEALVNWVQNGFQTDE